MYIYKGEEYNEKNLLKLYGLLLYEGKTALDYESFCNNALSSYEFLTSRGITYMDTNKQNQAYEFDVNIKFTVMVGGTNYDNAYKRLEPQLKAASEAAQFKINCGYYMQVDDNCSITVARK